jgi:glycosyltransferase involved in cell wall biosynthesis
MCSLNDITVIIPVYNCEKYIAESIESLLRQVGIGSPKIIVVNDGSDDNTSSILENYRQSIHLITTERIGQAAAINKALKIINTHFIAYQDADDLSEPNRLERLLKVFKENKDIQMVYSGRKIINSIGVLIEKDICKDFDEISIYQTNPITRSSVMHKSELIANIGNFDESISGNDDWDMWIRISEIANVQHVHEYLISYRIHSENLSTKRHRALYHNRICKYRILKKAVQRNPNIKYLIWIKYRALLNSVLLKSKITESPLIFWARIDRLQEVLEYFIIKTMSRVYSAIIKKIRY